MSQEMSCSFTMTSMN